MVMFLMVAAVTSFAQTGSRTGTFSSVTAAGVVASTPDTTTNTDTSYLYVNRYDFNQWDNVSFQFQNSEITGTVTSSMVVQGSNDATTAINGTWYTLINDATQNVSAVDTATVADTYYSFNIKDCQYKRLRIRNITGGTQTSAMSGTYYLASRYITNLN